MPMATTPSPISPFPTAQETEYAHHQSVHACAPAAADRCCRSGYIHAAGRGLCRRLGHALGRTAPADPGIGAGAGRQDRSEEHTSELQSLMRIPYAVFCLNKKKTH